MNVNLIHLKEQFQSQTGIVKIKRKEIICHLTDFNQVKKMI